MFDFFYFYFLEFKRIPAMSETRDLFWPAFLTRYAMMKWWYFDTICQILRGIAQFTLHIEQLSYIKLQITFSVLTFKHRADIQLCGLVCNYRWISKRMNLCHFLLYILFLWEFVIIQSKVAQNKDNTAPIVLYLAPTLIVVNVTQKRASVRNVNRGTKVINVKKVILFIFNGKCNVF